MNPMNIVSVIAGVMSVVKDAELGRVGKVGAGLSSLETEGGRRHHEELMSRAQTYRVARDQSTEANDQAKGMKKALPTLTKLFQAFLEGLVAEVVFLEPSRATKIPIRTSLEAADPLAWANELVPFFKEGHARDKSNAEAITKAKERYLAAGIESKTAVDAAELAAKQAKSAKLHLDEYVKQCERYINDHAPKDSPAHQHIKHSGGRRAGSARRQDEDKKAQSDQKSSKEQEKKSDSEQASSSTSAKDSMPKA
jgi:hypothetical protein